MFRTSFATLALILCLIGAASADVIHMKDGSSFEGQIVDDDGAELTVRVSAAATVKIPKKDVARIESKETRSQELSRRRKALAKGDAEAHYALALWCRKAGLSKDARKLLLELVAFSPDHASARRLLGQVRHDGRWINEADFYKARGFVRFKGRWVPKEEAAEAKLAASLKKKIAGAVRLYRKGDRRAIQAEETLLSLDHPKISGALLIRYLVDRRSALRALICTALGKLAYKQAASALYVLAMKDGSERVASAAAKALWKLGTTKQQTKVVQSLFAKSSKRRIRAANLLEAIADPKTIPYLIEALHLKAIKMVEQVQEEHGISRSGRRVAGTYGRYNLPITGGISVQRSAKVPTLTFLFNPGARRALQKMTGKDYDYDKPGWFDWWKKAGRTKLLGAPAPKAGASVKPAAPARPDPGASPSPKPPVVPTPGAPGKGG